MKTQLTHSRLKQNLVLGAATLGFAWASRTIYRELHRYDLAAKTVLITGGSRGLGLVLARQFAAKGARLILCARDEQELELAHAELTEQGADVSIYPCDVGIAGQVRSMIKQIYKANDVIDVVVNNAGMIQTGPMEAMTYQDYDQTMHVHFYGPLAVIEAVLPQMRKRREGHILNISSIGGRFALPHMLPYSASKFALVGYTLGLRGELAKDGIQVTAVCPGVMRTGSPRKALFKGNYEAEYAWFKIGDSIPGLSISAEYAARQFIKACEYNDGFVVLGNQYKVIEKFSAIFPGLMADAMGFVNQHMPAHISENTESREGANCESFWTESWLTTLTDQAAQRNNEMS